MELDWKLECDGCGMNVFGICRPYYQYNVIAEGAAPIRQPVSNTDHDHRHPQIFEP